MLYLKKNRESKLQESKAKIIIDYYNKKTLSLQENYQLEKTLGKIYKDKNIELHCKCMKIAVCNGKNRFYIRCDALHQYDCALKNREKIQTEPKAPRKPPDDAIVDLLPTGVERLPISNARDNINGQSGSGTKTVSRIIATIYDLLFKAGTNHFSHESREYADTIKAIKEAAKKIKIPSGMTLNDILHIDSYKKEIIKEKLKAKPETWPKGSTWHQVVLLSCHKFEEVMEGPKKFLKLYDYDSKKEKYSSPTKIRVYDGKTKVITPGNVSTGANGPFLFLFVFELKHGKDYHYIAPAKIGGIYVNSKSQLCPLESQYERGMLWALLNLLNNMDKNWFIEKPIYDEEGVRPDFKVRTPNGTMIAIEVAGMATPEYRATKERTQEKMRELLSGHLYEFDATESSNEFSDSIYWLKKHEILNK